MPLYTQTGGGREIKNAGEKGNHTNGGRERHKESGERKGSQIVRQRWRITVACVCVACDVDICTYLSTSPYVLS